MAKPGISEPTTPKGSQLPGTKPASTQDSGVDIPDSGFLTREQGGEGEHSTQQPSAEVLDRPQGSKHS